MSHSFATLDSGSSGLAVALQCSVPPARGGGLGEYSAFVRDPATATGALSDLAGTTVGPGQARFQSSTRQQRIDTEQIGHAAHVLGGVSADLAGTGLALVPLLLELQTVWAPLSGEAGRAAELCGEAQRCLLDVVRETADYAAKLAVAAEAYEHAETLAATVMMGFDSLHTVGFRIMYGSFLAIPTTGLVGSLPGITLGAVVEGGVFLLDARLRGTGSATASALQASGADVSTTLERAGMLKAAERSAGIGLVRPTGFREVDNGTRPGVRTSALGLEDLSRGIRSAGEHDQGADSVHGDQKTVALAHVDVTVVTRPDGTRAYLVCIPGSDFDPRLDPDEPNGAWTTLDAATARPENAMRTTPVLMQMVDRALAEAGASSEEEVLLTGFSQGGMAAMALAANREFASRHRIAGVMAQGAPDRAYGGIDPGIPVAQIWDANDPVTRVTGDRGAPANDHSFRIHTNVQDADEHPVVPMAHGGEEYLRAAAQADRVVREKAEGREYVQMLDRVVPVGSTTTTHTYEAGSEGYDDPGAVPGRDSATAGLRKTLDLLGLSDRGTAGQGQLPEDPHGFRLARDTVPDLSSPRPTLSGTDAGAHRPGVPVPAPAAQ